MILENVVSDQLGIYLILITNAFMILYRYSKEKFCLGHSQDLQGLTAQPATNLL